MFTTRRESPNTTKINNKWIYYRIALGYVTNPRGVWGGKPRAPPTPLYFFPLLEYRKVRIGSNNSTALFVINSLTSVQTHDSLKACQCAADDHVVQYVAECGCLVNHYDYACRASFASSRKGAGAVGAQASAPSVATARPTTEMNNFEPLINRQNFHHTRYSSESDIFRTMLLSWLRNWFAVYRYKNW